MKQPTIAFWKYDSFPYWLGGLVTEMNDEGRVQTEEYGKGHWFRPVFMLPEASGRALLKKLKDLETKHRDALKRFNNEWQVQVDMLTNPFQP